MKRIFILSIFWASLLILISFSKVSAQHGDPPPLPPDAWKGEVSGKIIDQTTGEVLAEPLDVMLHAWDTEEQERMMLHGKAEADGTFRFTNVDFHQTFVYSVMAVYLDATYFSETASVQKGETALKLDAGVYEATSDLSSITIDQLHTLFYIEDGEFRVTQFYTLSNSGKLTVKDAVTLPRDRTATLIFHLPEEAENVKFGNDPGGRYVLLPGAFADTAAITPGEKTSQVVVGYALPYEGEFVFEYIAPIPVQETSFMALQSSNLVVVGDGLSPAVEETLGDGTKFDVYKSSNLQAGDRVSISISGGSAGNVAVTTGEGATTVEPAKANINVELGIGAGVLGLSLLVACTWWWRRREEEVIEDDAEDTVEGILDEIQSLEEVHERGELPEDEYRDNRADLLERLKVVR